MSAGPDRADEMPELEARRYIDDASQIQVGVSGLCFSGGESFLDYPRLLRLAEFAGGKFKHISVITNAFWALSEAKALEKLEPLLEAGLTTLVVSSSPYHPRWVRPTRVGTAVTIADRLGLQTFVKSTGPIDGMPMPQVLAQAGPLPEATEVDEMPFLPGGRAAGLPASAFSLKRGLPVGRCPGSIVTIHPAGDAYFCCTPGGDTPGLRLGSARDEGLGPITQRYYTGGIQSLLRREGPIAFIPEITKAGVAHRQQEEYVNVCHLCTSLMRDPVTEAVVRAVGERHEAEVFASFITGAQVTAVNALSG